MKELFAPIVAGIVILGFGVSSTHASYPSYWDARFEVQENNLEMRLHNLEFKQEYVGTIGTTVNSLTDGQVQEIKDLRVRFENEMAEISAEYSPSLSFYEKELLF